MKSLLLIFYFVLCLVGSIFAESDFINQIYTIKIPGFPDAYNASLIKYENGFLMAFRHDTYKMPICTPQNLHFFKQRIGIVRLDSNFRVVGSPCILNHLGFRVYDPRLIKIEEKIYLICATAPLHARHSIIGSEICLAEIYPQKNFFSVHNFSRLVVNKNNTWEKNWSPFNYQGNLLLSYTINPHVVIAPVQNKNCKKIACTNPNINWPWGMIRGGTPAVLVNNEYLAIFHSSQNSQNGYTYYIGAYRFTSTPPFAVTHISSLPFSHSDFYSTPKTPLTASNVVFPCGLVVDEERIFVSYGENDSGIKIMELDKKRLYKSMVQVDFK